MWEKGDFKVSYILSIGTKTPDYYYSQEKAKQFVQELFHSKYKQIERLLTVFQNGQINGRYFSAPLEWFKEKHSFSEKNARYIQLATSLSVEAIKHTLENDNLLSHPVNYEDIDAIFFISSTGIATPSIDAKVMNELPFRRHMKRIPIWGLGCAGGASGIARANEYCKAFPKANVLVLCVELCSLTFQKEDLTKSNLIGTSLFADGVACSLICGLESKLLQYSKSETLPLIIDSQSTLMSDSEEVMGWEVKDTGLHVIFSKNIPTIIEKWLKPNLEHFLIEHQLTINDISQIIAHPGGKKVLDAYEKSLNVSRDLLNHSYEILKNYGNMSSVTVLFVMNLILHSQIEQGEYGLLFALGPGFSSECVLLKWCNKEEVA